MKKIRYVALLTGMLFLFTGCGAKEEVIEEVAEDVTEIISVEVESEMLSNLPQTKEELLTMPLEELKAMIEECIPNYREHFKVSEDYELQDSDWENFRMILSLELFGSAIIDNEEEETTETINEDPNAIYYEPTAEYINGLSDEELISYLSGLQSYMYPDMEPVDYSQLSSDELVQIKEALLKGIE